MEVNMIQMAQLGTSNAASVSAVSKVKAKHEDLAKAREAAETFESIFISQMLAPMFDTVPTDDMFGGGHAEKIYKGMQVEEYGKAITAGGGIGIADSIYAEILKTQEI